MSESENQPPSPEQSTQASLVFWIRNCDIEMIQETLDSNILSREKITEIIQKNIRRNFDQKSTHIIEAVLKMGIDLKTPEIIEQAQYWLSSNILRGDTDGAKKIISLDILNREEIVAVIRKEMLSIIRLTDIRMEILERILSFTTFLISTEVFTPAELMTPETEPNFVYAIGNIIIQRGEDLAHKLMVCTGLKKKILKIHENSSRVVLRIQEILIREDISKIKDILDFEIIDEHEIKKLYTDGLFWSLQKGDIDRSFDIIALFNLTPSTIEVINNPEIKKVLARKLTDQLIKGKIEQVNKILSFGLLDKESVEDCFYWGIINTASNNFIDQTKKIIALNILPENKLYEAVSHALKSHLEYRGILSEDDEIFTLDILTAEEKDNAKRIIRISNKLSLLGIEKKFLLKKTQIELRELESELDKNHVIEQIHHEVIGLYHEEFDKTKDTDDNLESNIISVGMKKMYEYFDDDRLIWKFLGQNDRHDCLQNIPYFISIIQTDPDKEKSKKIARTMFEHAGMGSGLQRQILVEIMGVITIELWTKLQTESALNTQQPSLADPNNINLARVRKEMRLFQMPEFIKAVNDLPTEKDSLRQYALTLVDHPTVNVDAIRNFVQNPDLFFASRTGGGEAAPQVANALTALSPENAPGDWTSTDARDAIIEGAYDRLNAFPPTEVSFKIKNETDNDKGDEPNISDARVELFLSQLSHLDDQENEHANEHLSTKGDVIIEKVLAFLMKRKKMTNEEEKNIKQKLTAAKDKSLITNDPTIFWNEVCLSGWLNTSDLNVIYKNISGDGNFKSEAELLTTIAESNEGKNVMEEVRENKLDTEIIFAVLAPSNPETATAGSTTGNCDAFGHGKKAHFMINPSTAQLMIYEKRKGSDERRVIGQSTLVDGKSIWQNAEDFKTFLNNISNTGKIGEALKDPSDSDELILQKLQLLLLRYTEGNRVITLDSLEVPPNIQATRYTPQQMFALCQMGFSKLGQANSRFDTTVQVGTKYSYLGEESSLPTHENTDVSTAPLAYTDNVLATSVLVQEKIAETKEPEGVRKLKPTDAFAVAIMEEIAFRRTNGDKYITGYLPMTQEVWTSTVEAEHRQHAPLSFICHNDKGVPNGYLIAFTQNDNEIYISDTATTGTEKGIGGALLFTFLRSVAADKKLNQMTISMDCRGATSALAISKNISVIEGMEFENSEGENISYKVTGPKPEEIKGDDTYRFKFTIKK